MIDVAKKELPEGWQWTTMDDIADVIGGGTPKSKEKKYFEGGKVCWITPADLSGYTGKHISGGARNITEEGLNSSSAKLMPADAILFTSRAPIGYVAIAKNEISTNQGFKSFVLKGKDVLPDYVYWWLKGNKQLAERMASGTTFLELSGSKAKQLPIPIAPLEQQKRIVAKIEKLFTHIDAGIASLQAAKKLLKQYRQSVLKAAVTGELTKDWRKANKDKLEPASQLLERILIERRQHWEEQQLEQFKAKGKGKPPKDDKWKKKYQAPKVATVDNLPLLPEEWVWASLPQIGELNRGKSKHRPRNDPSLYGGDYPFVQTGDIRAANTWLKEYSQTYSDKGLAQSRLWPIGTMCITIAANIADTAILDFNGCFPDSVVGFIPLNDSVNIEVVEYFFRTVKSDLEKYAPATAQKNINLAILETVAIPLLPLEEQIELINNLKYKISMADRLEEEIDRQLIKTEKSKKSILASAFSGILIGAVA